MSAADLPPHIARPTPAYELVGPMVPFRGQMVAVTSSPPRDTGDPRWRQCTDHRLACDCREAEQNEQISEMRSERRDIEEAIAQAIHGHPTWVYISAGTGGYGYQYGDTRQRRRDLECRCLGCDLARRMCSTSVRSSFFDNEIHVTP